MTDPLPTSRDAGTVVKSWDAAEGARERKEAAAYYRSINEWMIRKQKSRRRGTENGSASLTYGSISSLLSARERRTFTPG